MTVSALGDSALVLSLGEAADATMAARVQAVAAEINRHGPAGMVDVVPAFASVAVFFDPHQITAIDALRADIESWVSRAESTMVSLPSRRVELPVCYEGDFAPDLADVAKHAGLSASDVVAAHTHADYLVHAIGFVPGFPYLGGLPPKLATPRRPTPRTRVPAGAVGIGGTQTGVYPFETPGGWNLIGCTPVALFDAARSEPALLRVGDRVTFRAISPEAFLGEMAAAAAAPAAAPKGRKDLLAPVPGIEVRRAGMFTTIQDLGRRGHRASGVPLSGAADPFALRLLNLLVGNDENAAGLEYTLVGPELKFLHDTVVALGGAEFGGLPRWRPVTVAAGTVFKLGSAPSGCRGYLAVAGGIEVPPLLGSRSTYVRAALGGFAGRALRDGDVLPVPAPGRAVRDHWSIDPRILPSYSPHAIVRVVAGAQAPQYAAGWSGRTYRISSRSDRMGVRLSGEPLVRTAPHDLLSSPVAPGTIQVPPDGQPIILLADAQTIGGYPQLAHVISPDLPLVAQLRPGDTVQFRLVSLADAAEVVAAQEKTLALLREGIATKVIRE